MRKLRLIINVIDSSEKTIDCALNSDFSDFEDAIQYYTAQNHKLTTIVTRNVKDYKDSNLSVETPEMFLCSREFV
jgi:predicted nucleic acid-binding protein